MPEILLVNLRMISRPNAGIIRKLARIVVSVLIGPNISKLTDGQIQQWFLHHKHAEVEEGGSGSL